MVLNEQNILAKTHYGLDIYQHILRQHYPNAKNLKIEGWHCTPASNPFLHNEESLHIYWESNVFLFIDTIDKWFYGTPIEFAEHHYKMGGIQLLSMLNKELCLNLIETSNIQIPTFCFFKSPVTNAKPCKVVDIVETYKLVKGDSYKTTTETLRSIQNTKEAKSYKSQNFDYVTFSGTFSHRNNDSLIKHSGLITIDFDHVSNIETLKEQLLNDDFFETELLFVSPSGDGLKWIIPIDLNDGSHLLFFTAIEKYIKETYNLDIDKSGKDVSRACFLPYDTNCYINPKYLNK